jgi:hypothetical protein
MTVPQLQRRISLVTSVSKRIRLQEVVSETFAASE